MLKRILEKAREVRSCNQFTFKIFIPPKVKMKTSVQSKYIKLHAIDDSQLLMLATRPAEFYFSGFLNVKTLCGSIEIMGYKMTPSQPSIMAFSAKENCLLKINMLHSDSNSIDELFLKTLNFSDDLIQKILSHRSLSHLILLTKNKKQSLLPALKFYNMPVFFREDTDLPIADSVEPDITRYCKYQDLDQWNPIFHKLASREHPKTVLCGGSGVGKSTLLKFLLNRSLEKWSKVIVIDLDPGQAEFTVMGCLSVISVQQPVVGPNFTHLITPEKSLYFGDNNVSDHEEKYTRLVQKLVDYCQTNFSCVPWFVNTMGFTKSVGIKLLFHAMKNVHPTDVIQIVSSNDESKNFPQQLTPHFWKHKYSTSELLKYQLHCLPSAAKSNQASFDVTACGLNSPTRRNIVTLSYFSQVIHSGGDLLKSIPKKIPLRAVKISISKLSSDYTPSALSKFQLLSCINANMVALCRDNEDDDLMDWIGYGVVRGFDADAEELFIVTPISDAQLLRVNCICMSSSIQLPEVVYRHQAHPAGNHVPYVMKVSKALTLHQKIKKTSSRKKLRN